MTDREYALNRLEDAYYWACGVEAWERLGSHGDARHSYARAIVKFYEACRILNCYCEEM